MLETFKELPSSDIPILRGNFGAGKAGDDAFKIIVNGATCERKVGNKKFCDEKAIMTVDFDAPRVNVLVQVPVCSNSCFLTVQRDVYNECVKQGKVPSFGVSGQGRA